MFIKAKALLLIIQKHLTKKWGRVLLAQAGIMIGIWAISLTSSLSLGLSDKIVTAINSQPSSREISLYKLESGKTSFFEVSDAPKFVMLGKQEVTDLANSVGNISSIAPSTTMSTYIKSATAPSEYNCVDENLKNSKAAIPSGQDDPLAVNIALSPNQATPSETSPAIKEFQKNCSTFTFSSTSFQSFSDNNRTNLIGKKEKVERGEISVCFKCGDLKLNEKLGISKPEEMIGKSLVLDIKQTPNYKLAGEIYDTSLRQPANKDLKKSNPITLKIVSVVDDSKANNNIFSGPSQESAYIDFSYFEDSIRQSDPTVDINKVGYIQSNLTVSSYDKLDGVIEKIKEKKYLPFSPAQLLIGGIKTLFTVLTYFLAAFGLIVLISSIFGIINVMTISVLERRKEIGIIKSLGGNNTDIFVVFLFESIFLGFVGWLLGTLLALGSGKIISAVVIGLINSNPTWKDNLSQFNINDFTPVFPWELLAITFGLSIFFTSLSGLIPSIRAAKQNIVEVLRSE